MRKLFLPQCYCVTIPFMSIEIQKPIICFFHEPFLFVLNLTILDQSILKACQCKFDYI